MEEAILKVKDLSLSFKGIKTLNHVSMEVKPKTLHAIIGPNGAGKTSLLNCISGFYRPQAGEIWCNSRNLITIAPHEIGRMGIARAFQNIELFGKMTVFNNLMLGRHRFMGINVIKSAMYWGSVNRQEKEHQKKVREIISILYLDEYADQAVGSLPYGIQKRVELGRALALEPNLLLLDEPVAGMSSKEKEETVHYILKVKEQMGLTILLIEHDMKIVMSISEHITVLNFGEKIAEDSPRNILKDERVIEAYLGTSDS